MGGALLGGFIAAYDHWVAFAAGPGGWAWAILESRASAEEGKSPSNPFAWRALLVLGVATSIDALAVESRSP
jgi:putative Mn2+ efflux pump MntP